MWNGASLDRLKSAVASYDRVTTQRLCDELIETITASDGPFDQNQAKAILDLLRRKRFFGQMRAVADAFIQTGQSSANVRRQYAQALIEQGELSAAIDVLKQLILECAEPPAEVAEARGLIGRALKQQYMNNPKTTAAQRRTLNDAIAIYQHVYVSARSEYLWHGINAVALAKRAKRDGVPVETDIDADQPEQLLAAIGRMTPDRLHAWDMGTAAEACVALGRFDQALDWMRQYVADPCADAFQVASTLRQLKEVWCLDESGPGSDLIAVLKAALLEREGGGIQLSAKDVQVGLERTDARRDAFEKVFGRDGPVTYQWYMEGAARALAVGRVEDPLRGPMGSGFLIRASDFFDWGKDDDLLFITNAHVMGRTESGALAPERAEVRFEASATNRACKVKMLLWESPMSDLDATVVRLEGVPADLEPLTLAGPEEPEFFEGVDRRFYVIGHPNGGLLSLSLHDNMQVGWRRPLLHYRTPTEPGSSGSPVLDKDWKLVALHHAGHKQMKRLDGHVGVYEANEGIWIHEIIRNTRQTSASMEARAVHAPAANGDRAALPDPLAPGAERQGIFLSYSHKDLKHIGEFETFLHPSIRSGNLVKWDDRDIPPGANWLKEIRRAIASCRVAVLLVSQNYIASDFISTQEFPQIIRDSSVGDMKVFWIALSPSTFDKTELAFLQAANDPKRPLTTLVKAERQAAWVRIADKLENLARSHAPG